MLRRWRVSRGPRASPHPPPTRRARGCLARSLVHVPLAWVDHRIERPLVAPHAAAQACPRCRRFVLRGRGRNDLCDDPAPGGDAEALSAADLCHVLRELLPQLGDLDVFHACLICTDEVYRCRGRASSLVLRGRRGGASSADWRSSSGSIRDGLRSFSGFTCSLLPIWTTWATAGCSPQRAAARLRWLSAASVVYAFVFPPKHKTLSGGE